MVTTLRPDSLCVEHGVLEHHGLIAHFFLALNSILFFHCITVYLSSHLLKDILAAFSFWQLLMKL